MSTLSRCRLLAAVAAVSFMAGCGRSPEPAATSPATTATSTTAAFASPPWLRQHLPEHTVAYLRLPSLWGLLSAPNQRGADAMYGNPAHEKVIAQLRQALAGNAVTADILGSDSADRVLRALSSVQAPIEIAFTARTNPVCNSCSAVAARRNNSGNAIDRIAQQKKATNSSNTIRRTASSGFNSCVS